MSSYVQTLRTNLQSLRPNRAATARDLLAKFDRGERMSANALQFLQDLAQEAEKAAAPAAPAPTVGDLSALHDLFNKTGLKTPKVRLAAPDGTRFKISKAGPASANAGCLYVKGADGYLGKIDLAGVFRPAFGMLDVAVEPIKAAIAAFTADPASVGAAYGHATGECCFCGLGLTDARSVRVGYGPICAANYGLPWGEPDPNDPAPKGKKARKAKTPHPFIKAVTSTDHKTTRIEALAATGMGRPAAELVARTDLPGSGMDINTPRGAQEFADAVNASGSLKAEQAPAPAPNRYSKPVQLCFAL